MSISSPNRVLRFIPMSGEATWDSTAVMPRCVMGSGTGQQTPMVMGFEKFTPIPLKASGRPFAITCVPFGGFTRSCLPDILPSVSFALISSVSRLILSQNSSLALNLNMSQSEFKKRIPHYWQTTSKTETKFGRPVG